MSITIDVAPDVEQRIQKEAAKQGQDVHALVRQVVEERFGTSPTPKTRIANGWTEEQLADWNAMLDSFSEGEPEEQRASFEQLKRDLEEDRPGQRSVFGTGFNPPLPQSQAEQDETEAT